MRGLLVLSLTAVGLVICQTQNKNSNPTGEIGSPAFDEIVVHSTLTVRGKSGSRGAKALVSENRPKTVSLLQTNSSATVTSTQAPSMTAENKKTKREANPRRNYSGLRYGGFEGFPSSSSSSSQASSNAFNQNTPFGSFGGSASQTASQSHSFGPGGIQASAGQSSSQTYRLPNGNQIDVAFSSGYNTGKGRPSFSNSHAITLTKPNGQQYNLARRR